MRSSPSLRLTYPGWLLFLFLPSYGRGKITILIKRPLSMLEAGPLINSSASFVFAKSSLAPRPHSCHIRNHMWRCPRRYTYTGFQTRRSLLHRQKFTFLPDPLSTELNSDFVPAVTLRFMLLSKRTFINTTELSKRLNWPISLDILQEMTDL